MVEKGISQWSEGSSKFIFNSVRSPDGALGFFMLLPKNPLKTYNSSKILNLLNFKCPLSKIINSSDRARLQDKFEDYTEELLKKIGDLRKSSGENISDYDFEINKTTIEVKSDKWMFTGNISLELLRDYKFDYDRNAGSIIKTKADYWQVYFYNSSSDQVESILFETSILKNHVDKILKKIDKEI